MKNRKSFLVSLLFFLVFVSLACSKVPEKIDVKVSGLGADNDSSSVSGQNVVNLYQTTKISESDKDVLFVSVMQVNPTLLYFGEQENFVVLRFGLTAIGKSIEINETVFSVEEGYGKLSILIPSTYRDNKVFSARLGGEHNFVAGDKITVKTSFTVIAGTTVELDLCVPVEQGGALWNGDPIKIWLADIEANPVSNRNVLSVVKGLPIGKSIR